MEVALVTVGDELLAGDTENTNATWLARQLATRGATVPRILVLPDDRAVVADAVRDYRERFDAVVVTGGLGGTHDDVTMEAVADALDRDLAVSPDARADVEATIAAFREANPDLEERFPDLSIDVDAQASVPDGARPLLNEVGLSPGCVADGVYVLPGIPDEMRAMFAAVADEFGGDVTTRVLYTPAPEGALTAALAGARERFDVGLGSYPARGAAHNRIKVVGSDDGTVEAAVAWLAERVETVDPERTEE